MSRSSVVLPLPEAPMIATILPRGTLMVTPFRTGWRPYEKFTDWTSTRISSGTRELRSGREAHFSSFARAPSPIIPACSAV